MNDFWIYNKIFKDYVNKARLWDLMTTYKKQEKTQTRLELATKEKKNDIDLLYMKKSSQWYACKGAQNKTKKKNVIVKELENIKQRNWMSYSSMW